MLSVNEIQIDPLLAVGILEHRGVASRPGQALHRTPEPGKDRVGQFGLPHRGGARRLEPEAGADHEGRAPRSGRVVRRDEAGDAHLEPPGVLEDQTTQCARKRGSQPGDRRVRWWAGGGRNVAEPDDPLGIGDPQEGEPPAVWGVRRTAHARPIDAFADVDFVLAQERRAGRR